MSEKISEEELIIRLTYSDRNKFLEKIPHKLNDLKQEIYQLFNIPHNNTLKLWYEDLSNERIELEHRRDLKAAYKFAKIKTKAVLKLNIEVLNDRNKENASVNFIHSDISIPQNSAIANMSIKSERVKNELGDQIAHRTSSDIA